MKRSKTDESLEWLNQRITDQLITKIKLTEQHAHNTLVERSSSIQRLLENQKKQSPLIVQYKVPDLSPIIAKTQQILARSPSHKQKKTEPKKLIQNNSAVFSGQIQTCESSTNLIQESQLAKSCKSGLTRTPSDNQSILNEQQNEAARKEVNEKDQMTTSEPQMKQEKMPKKEVNNDFLNHLNGINIQKKKKIQETMHDQRKRQIKCMSFNLLNGQRQKEMNQNWEQRFNAVISVILTHGPDIIGTQEAYHWQLDQIRNHLPLYGQYGSSRNGFYNEKADEFCAVLYKKDKFRVVQGETFFLSETPELVSKSWGSVFNRIATAVKFEILASGKQFWFFSTQLDFSSDEAVRCNQTQVLLERMQKLNAEGLPVVLSGDFHSPSFGPAHQKLTQDGRLRDAASKAREVGKMTESSVRGSDMQARKNRLYEGLFGKKTHQDWIFTDKDTEVLTFAVCTDKYDGVYPALHYPIVSDLEFK
ncbi:endonuclease/exonuclease/phosphatase_family protein [Hexamita inflata]|uniref:Endonuclease/exonuclease/phosphatase family protein n=1 Tax=Hexamita inflata TaxID=28002 RepID=A0AA86PPZ1_9EUKA|nr:endonuclease/exonuclease/phosphatase family protein [Hexamita inflata]